MEDKERITIPLEEWYNDYALEVELVDDDAFLKVKETLTRIGVCSNRDKRLFQSCHILSKKNKYYIVHFKELFALDGRSVDISENTAWPFQRNPQNCVEFRFFHKGWPSVDENSHRFHCKFSEIVL